VRTVPFTSLLVVLLVAATAGSAYFALELRQEAGRLASANLYLQEQISLVDRAQNRLLQNYSDSQILSGTPVANRTIAVWTILQTIPPKQHLAWEMLDTFVNHIRIESNISLDYYVFDIENFLRFMNGSSYVSSVHSNGTSFVLDEYLTEGCGIYLLYIQNPTNRPALIAPTVTATFAPTPFLTGACNFKPVK